jgi:hypothetical protein
MEIKVFAIVLLVDKKDRAKSGDVQIITDPHPVGRKTLESTGPGRPTDSILYYNLTDTEH